MTDTATDADARDYGAVGAGPGPAPMTAPGKPTPGRTLAYVDTETTSLDPHTGEIWEVGLVLRRPDGGRSTHSWLLPVNLAQADPMSLAMNGFHDRFDLDKVTPVGSTWDSYDTGGRFLKKGFADQFADLTRKAVLIGAVPSFDERRLWDLLRRHGQCPMWHYQPIDAETLVAGYLIGVKAAKIRTGSHDEALVSLAAMAASPPWDSGDLSRAVGVNPAEFDRHSALGDALWAEAMYLAVVGAVAAQDEK
jgi:hypothetical protein